MHLADVLDPERIAVDISVSSKKSLLEKAAELLATSPDSGESREIFESLCQRERLGSTGLGHGVAIPHGRVNGQSGVSGALIRLRHPIDFDAPDQEKVDLFFALSVPDQCSDVYLRLLADVAQRFGDAGQREQLRSADSAEALLRLFAVEPDAHPAA
ncbi:PTS sugar transporter subunit IIA [Wenzhouxiangella marina]|uniref:PTS IIA-like nitrogen-regulatory protein PtsN n=1 Tax=Wenzhouxiangella marina TaxID=1579979 RepID=A0A0K0XYP7_9GAMM|nr:PTS sugar transporter subunit IIA [Wenzhouxiangella marina]AKS42795.1 PTS IIA-like nitrogen-regulatory protein PtsN [Wenzhouxiangella marina]MBB6087527.1 PTS system nitrogen regulatory IIA component [Wenzhouxiangella marina]